MRVDQFTSGTPLQRLGIGHAVKVVGCPPSTTGMTIPVRTPEGDVLIHPYCPSYYNPPLAYDRCSPPRPFDYCNRPPTIPNISMKPTCDCKNPGTCSGTGTYGNCTCQEHPGALVHPKPSTNRGYFGEHHVNDRGYDWQFGQHAGETVFGPKGKKGKKLTEKERKLALNLLTGDFDSLIEHLQGAGVISERIEKAEVGGLAPPRVPVQIDAAPPSVPRMYVLVHRGPVMRTNELARLINLRLGSFFDLCRRPCACPRGPMTYNPYGSVNGLGVVYGPKNAAEAKLSGEQVVSLADLMMVEEGFNPAKNPKLRKIYAAALLKELNKEGLTVRGFADGSWIVEGPYLQTTGGLFDFVGKAVKSIGKAVTSAAKAVEKAVIKPVTGFVQKAGGTIIDGIKSIDSSLGITDSLKDFVGGAGSLLGDNFPMLAGAALTAVTGGAAAPLLGALGPMLGGGGGGLGAIGQAATSLLGGGGAGGIGDLLGKLAGAEGGIGGALSSILGQGSGGLASVLGSILGSGGSSAIQQAGQQLQSAAQEVVPAADPISALLGGQTGILGALGGNLGRLGGGALNVLAGAGSQAIQRGGFDFASLLSNLQNLSRTGGAGAMGGLLAADVPQQVRNLLAAQVARGGGVAGAVRRARETSGHVDGQHIARVVAGVLAYFGESPQQAWSVGHYCAASVPASPTVSGGPLFPSGDFGEQMLVGVLREVCLANGERRAAA